MTVTLSLYRLGFIVLFAFAVGVELTLLGVFHCIDRQRAAGVKGGR